MKTRERCATASPDKSRTKYLIKKLLPLIPIATSLANVQAATHESLRAEQIQLYGESPYLLSFERGSNMVKPKEGYGTYVVEHYTSCSSGETIIPLFVPQVLNSSVLTDGKISEQSYTDVIGDNKTIVANAQLSMPVYDIDSGAQNGEVDKVYFNDHFLGKLSGSNNEWSDGSQVVPIEHIKFGQVNYIKIEIDVNKDGWCMGTDWAALEFNVATPLVLVHGINASSTSWDDKAAPGFLNSLDKTGIVYSRPSLLKSGRSKTNSFLLNDHIKEFIDPLSADEVNIIAHSKGGLDSQWMYYNGTSFDIKSLTTISTPHRGSVLADIQAIEDRYSHSNLTIEEELVSSFVDRNLLVSVGLWCCGPKYPGMKDLETQESEIQIIAGQRAAMEKKRFFSIGGDADTNHNSYLDYEEMIGFVPLAKAGESSIRATWEVLRGLQSVHFSKVVAQEVPFGTDAYGNQMYRTVNYNLYIPENAPFDRYNDLAVTDWSARPQWTSRLFLQEGHHSTVKSSDTFKRILENNNNILLGGM